MATSGSSRPTVPARSLCHDWDRPRSWSPPRTAARASSGWRTGATAAAVRETQPGFKRALRWGTPRRKTAHPGPALAGEWMICGSRGLARTSRTSWRNRAVDGDWSVRKLEAEITRGRQSGRQRPTPHPDHVAAAATLEETVRSALGVGVQARPHRSGYQLLLDQAARDRLVRLVSPRLSADDRAKQHAHPAASLRVGGCCSSGDIGGCRMIPRGSHPDGRGGSRALSRFQARRNCIRTVVPPSGRSVMFACWATC